MATSSVLPTPQEGMVRNGFQFTGGNPADQSSWVPVAGTDTTAPSSAQPEATLSAAPPESLFHRLKDTVANSAIGYSLEQAMPRVADALDLHPTETVYSPDYEAHKGQILSPDYLVPSTSHGAAASLTRGALKGAGAMTSGPALATVAGAAITGGLLSPAVPAIGRLMSVGFTLQGANNLIHQVPEVYHAFQSGDTEKGYELLGSMGFDVATMAGGARHAIAGEAAPNSEVAPETVPAASRPDENTPHPVDTAGQDQQNGTSTDTDTDTDERTLNGEPEKDPRDAQRAATAAGEAGTDDRSNGSGRSGEPSYTYTRRGSEDAESLRSVLGVPTLESWSLDPAKAKELLEENDYHSPDIHELDYNNPQAAEVFQRQIAKSKETNEYAASVYVYPVEDYANGMRMFLTQDGKAGFGLKPDGDIVSVFSHGDNPKGIVHTMVEVARQAGGNKLDCFDTVLPSIYRQHDFRTIDRIPWNGAYRPEGWDEELYRKYNNGKPDFVLMQHDPTKIDVVHYSNNPDITRLDPQYYGQSKTHDVRGDVVNRPDLNRKNAFPQYWNNETYVGDDSDPLFREKGAERFGVRQNTYKGQVSAARIYDLGADPDGILDQSRKELEAQKFAKFGVRMQSSDTEVNAYAINKLKELGYSGRRDINGMIASWERIPVQNTGVSPAEDVRRFALSGAASELGGEHGEGYARPATEQNVSAPSEGATAASGPPDGAGEVGGRGNRSETLQPSRNEQLHEVSSEYNREHGLPEPSHYSYAKVDENQAKAVADAYEQLVHDPNDPRVQKSYAALIRQVEDQWQHAIDSGFKFEPWNREGQPYRNSKEMVDDVEKNHHLYFFQGGDMPSDHPLATIDPRNGLTYNDKFRAIHDFYGHAKGGYQFGPRGEENAYLAHREMFDNDAIPALTTETKGQNSWVNYGEHMRDSEGNVIRPGQPGYISQADRPYAEQKAGILPNEMWDRTVYGANNKLVTTDEADAARQRLNQRLVGSLHAGIPVDALPDLIKVGTYHLEATARSFGAWSKQMVGEFGEGIKPYLDNLWEDAIKEGSSVRLRKENEYSPTEQANGGRENQDVQYRIGTRKPTGKKATESGHDLVIDGDAVARSDYSSKLPDILSKYPNMRKTKPSQTVNEFVDQLRSNLEWLYNQIPKDVSDNTKQWYNGARRIAEESADQHGIETRQAAGATASLSPQKDWDMNVSLLKRVLDTHFNRGDEVTSQAMLDKANDIAEASDEHKRKNALKAGKVFVPDPDDGFKRAKRILTGKAYNDLTDPYEKAMFSRLYDEVNNPREYEKINPDGSVKGLALNDNGKPGKVAWGSLNEAAKAISILEDGSRDNISDQLGNAHKVRNFYNNILLPNTNPFEDVTVDTHAVAAALLRPLSGNSTEVTHNFGGAGKSALTGAGGTYGLYADAYRQAARNLGISPRELQSVTWEAIRELFPAEFKTAKNNATIDNIWKEYKSGKQTLNATRQRILDASAKPAWLERSRSGVHGEASHADDAGNVSGLGLRGSPGGTERGGGRAATGAVPKVTKADVYAGAASALK